MLQCFPSHSLVFLGLISFLGNDIRCLNQFHSTTLWQGADGYTRIKRRKERVYLKYYLKTRKRPCPLSQKTPPLGWLTNTKATFSAMLAYLIFAFCGSSHFFRIEEL